VDVQGVSLLNFSLPTIWTCTAWVSLSPPTTLAVWTCRMYPFPQPAVWTCRVCPFTLPAVWTCRVCPFTLPAVWTCRVCPFLPCTSSMDVSFTGRAGYMPFRRQQHGRAECISLHRQQCERAGCVPLNCQQYGRAWCVPFYHAPAVLTCRVYPFLNAGMSDSPASSQSGTEMNRNAYAGTSPLPK
jgi:hypothetical protein